MSLPPRSTLFPYTTLFRSKGHRRARAEPVDRLAEEDVVLALVAAAQPGEPDDEQGEHREQDQHDGADRSEEHTSELQSRENLVCRLLLEKKKKDRQTTSRR